MASVVPGSQSVANKLRKGTDSEFLTFVPPLRPAASIFNTVHMIGL